MDCPLKKQKFFNVVYQSFKKNNVYHAVEKHLFVLVTEILILNFTITAWIFKNLFYALCCSQPSRAGAKQRYIFVGCRKI